MVKEQNLINDQKLIKDTKCKYCGQLISKEEMMLNAIFDLRCGFHEANDGRAK